MSSIGFNASPPSAGGCGGATPAAPGAVTPAIPAGFTGGGFSIPGAATPAGKASMAMPASAAPERFASSMAGGVILDGDGAPAGRIPAGSFVDTRDGMIFGPDGKTITLPEGASADFFDLPDIKKLIEMNRTAAAGTARTAELQKATVEGGGATASGPNPKGTDHAPTTQSFVDGQWGPGGVTPIKGGGAASCDMDHGATAKAGGATLAGATGAKTSSSPITSATGAGATTAVAGASGGGAVGTLESLTTQINSIMEQLKRLTPTPTSGGGGTLAAATGASALGPTDALRLSVNDLVGVIAQLNVALERVGIRGGGPGQGPLQLPLPQPKLPPTPPPTVGPPRTETSPMSSISGNTTTAPPASGSSSS